jgi:archaellum component FlaF (FlaF/FlaG flagellin family)
MKQLTYAIIILVLGFVLFYKSCPVKLNEKLNLIVKNDTISELSKVELAFSKANYENSEKLLTHTYWVIDVILIGFFVSIIISFIAFWWNNEKLKEEMKKYVTNQIDSEVEDLRNMIKGYNYEKELIQKTRIMILVKNGVEIPTHVQLVLRQFNNPIKRNLSSISTIIDDYNDYDIIFFYNEDDNKWDENWSNKSSHLEISEEHKKLLEFINTKLQGGLIYFGTFLSFERVTNSKKHLISASNFSSQIYGNMLNQMKLLHALKNN